MNVLSFEDRHLIEDVAETLGFHNIHNGLSAINLADSWNRHDITSRLTRLTNTLSLADLSVKAHISASQPGNVIYSVIKI